MYSVWVSVLKKELGDIFRTLFPIFVNIAHTFLGYMDVAAGFSDNRIRYQFTKSLSMLNNDIILSSLKSSCLVPSCIASKVESIF